MAVIVREMVDFGDGLREVKAYYPKGILSKAQREKADRLDAILSEALASVAASIQAELADGPDLEKWHALGRGLQFLRDPTLVDPADLEGDVWRAVRQRCPEFLRPRGSDSAKSEARRAGGSLDHYRFCYAVGAFELADIAWMRRWSDWITLVESPGILRDMRILGSLNAALGPRGSSLTRLQFRRLAKELRSEFSTARTFRDSSVLSETAIREAVQRAVDAAFSDRA